MTTRELLRELEQKLLKADGPSRELDEAILHTFEIEHSCKYHSLNSTDSVDKTLGLIQELTLETDGGYADWILSKTNGGLTISARIGPQTEESFGETPALALLLALVRLEILRC